MSLFDKVKQVLGMSGEGKPAENEIKPADPTVYPEDLVAFVDKEFKRRQEERRMFELQWRLNLCFFEGQQYVDINTAAWTLEEQPPLYDWQEREVFNHIAPNIEVRISKLKRVRSILKVRPGSTEQEDLHSARIGTMILRNNYVDQRIQDVQAEELAWMETCGTVFRKHIWNPKRGPSLGVMVQPDPVTGEEQQIEVREGDGETIVVPPQEFFPDNCYCNDINELKSCIHARVYDVDIIREIWGVEVSPDRADVEKFQRAMNGLGGLGYSDGGFFLHTVKLEHHAIVKEYWERPSEKYPGGRLIIVAGGKLLHYGPLPYMVEDDGQPGLPFSRLVCLQRPGIFWGKTVLERLIPIQRRYNALRNRKAEFLNRCSIGQWIVEEGAVEDLDVFEQQAGAPGAIHVKQHGFEDPKMVQNPSLPMEFQTEEATLLNEFAILSGVSEVSRQSEAPTGVKSGVALALVQEQDDTRLSNTVENIERHNIHSGKMQLRLAKQFVKAPRTLHEAGKNNVAAVIDWVGADIKSDDVILDNMAAVMESVATRRQMVFDLLGTGLLNDPKTGQMNNETRSKVLEMIEMGDWESADDTDQLHIAKAERETKAMQQGRLPQPVDYDDHILHISCHNKFRLSVDYEEMVAQNPMVAMIFDAHVNTHLQFMAQAAMAQVQAQMAQAAEVRPPGNKPSAEPPNSKGGGENAA